MTKRPINAPRLAVIRCDDAAWSAAAAARLSGRILLALRVPPGGPAGIVTGFDFITSEDGTEAAAYPSLLQTAGVTATETVIIRTAKDLERLAEALPAPVRYRVFVTAPDKETGAAFQAWVTEEHAPELLALPGCSDFRVCRVSEKELACEYLFTSENALKTYYRDFAEAMRGRYKLKFPSADIRFTREEAIVAGCGFKRDAADYSS